VLTVKGANAAGALMERRRGAQSRGSERSAEAIFNEEIRD